MKNLKNGFMATCVLATVLGAQLAAFAWTNRPYDDGWIIGSLCAEQPSRDQSDCHIAKCEMYASTHDYNACLMGAYHYWKTKMEERQVATTD